MIVLKDVTLRRGTKVVLDGANAVIQPGEKVGLIGRNGAGKSSLFALLLQELHEDGGEFSVPAHQQVASVAQNMPETTQGATDFVLAGDERLERARLDLARLEAQMPSQPTPSTDGSDDFGQAYGEAYAQAFSVWEDAGGHDARARAQTLILGLGFAVSELDQPVNSFSGGWRMRLQLARALMCPSDVLLLDEPTNHLDLDALVWLEGWLARYEGTLLVISHDREFLDAVTAVTLHLEAGKLTRYGGNYSQFETLRAQAMSLQAATYAKQQEKMAHLQRFIDRFKAKASKAKQAQSRVKALERMEKVAPLLAQAEFSFAFEAPAQLPNPMLTISDGAFGYGQKVVVQGVNRSVLAGQRIGVLGANGQGKSTVVKTIAQTMPLLGGDLQPGRGLHMGYFAQQELDVLQAQDDALQHMARLARQTEQAGLLRGQSTREQDLRGFLGAFNFTGDQVRQAVGTMSGGEKARLVLAMMVWQRPNLLLLDEPTNHLDLATREALAMALNDFEGTVMLVSHDRALLRAVCDEFWLVAQGTISPFDGDLDDYQRYLLEHAKQARKQQTAQKHTATPKDEAHSKSVLGATLPDIAPVNAAVVVPVVTAASSGLSKGKQAQIRKELTQLEAQMEQLQAEKQQAEYVMTEQATDAQAVQAAAAAHTRIAKALETAELRWLELSELLG